MRIEIRIFEHLNHSHQEARAKDQEKIMIELNIDIWSILYISEVSEIFRAKFQLSMVWLDQRLHFFNLKNDSYLNIITIDEADLIWYPVVVFLNTQNMDQSIVIK